MPSFSDFQPDSFPDFDITPEEEEEDFEQSNFFPFVDDETAFMGEGESQEDDPGAGDSYEGTDPSVFDEMDDQTDNQSAPAVQDPQSFGQKDDPEAKENIGDEAYDDDEDDTSDPALIDAGETVSSVGEVRYPEQGIDSDELTYVPLYQPSDEVEEPVEEVAVAQEEEDEEEEQALEDDTTREDIGDNPSFLQNVYDTLSDQFDSLVSAYDLFLAERIDPEELNILSLFTVNLFSDKKLFFDIDQIYEEFGFPEESSMLEDGDDITNDLVTSPTLLAGFAEMEGSIAMDTYLSEFQGFTMEDV